MELKQLTDKEVNFFLEVNAKIEGLYEKRDKMIKKIMAERGSSQGVIKVDGDEKPFKRVTLVDNIERIMAGETLYKNAAFSRYSVDVSSLKNEPKVSN